ncbi:MAG: hypothetical protein OSB41_08045 [Kiritimatiellae bacterium]|nr:hypothetical protein [Kiritimatiellia bacterium]
MRLRSNRVGQSRLLTWALLAAACMVCGSFSPAFAGLGDISMPKGSSLTLDAWTFDRGNAGVSENPGTYGDYRDRHPELIITGDGQEPWFVEYDVDFPVSATFTLNIRYASASDVPLKVWLDDTYLGECCGQITGNPGPYPDRMMSYKVDLPERKWNMHGAQWEKAMAFPVTQGKHTLRFTCDGVPPNPTELRLDSSLPFPEGWKVPPSLHNNQAVRHLQGERQNRKVVVDRVPVRYRNVFLPVGGVNVEAMRLAINDTIKAFGPAYSEGPQYLKQLAELEAQQRSSAESGSPEQLQANWDSLVALREQAMFEHPALDFNALLFVKSKYQASSTYRKHNANTTAQYAGGNLCVLSPVSPDGKVTELVPELSGGVFHRFDLSFDATRVLFSYAKENGRFRIYEIEIDPKTGLRVPGTKLRQITFGKKEEAEAMARGNHGGDSVAQDGFQDLDPCYLTNGNIVFASTRSQRSVLCFPQSVSSIHTMRSDGSDIRCLSEGQVNELNPTVLDDGRIAYMRWEYVDKGFGNAQSLWAIRPDGSGSDHIYKNNLVAPGAMVQPRSIPNSRKLITIGAGHHGGLHGPVLLVDNRRNRRTAEGMENVTPEVRLPAMNRMPRSRGAFKEPYPFSETFYLVSHRPDGLGNADGYGIYALDYWGNRAELYRDPVFSCSQPMAVRPRRKPVSIAPVSPHAVAKDAYLDEKTTQENLATMFMLDVYQGLEGIERGRVKFVRVMEAKNLAWTDQGRASRQKDGVPNWQSSAVSYQGDVARKKSWGVATVHEDGSVRFTVPSEKNVFFQVLDENYMELHRMRSFINFQPGEKRSCIGCHETRREAPPIQKNAMPMALTYPVQALQAQLGQKKADHPVHFAVDVQPIFDQKCVSCHGGNEPKGDLDLTHELTTLFSKSYETLVDKKLVSSLRTDGFGSAMLGLEPPLTYGSHKSILVDRLKMDPCKADVTQEEIIRITTWIDANAPYYGTHRGKKNLAWKGEPDFRPVPDHTD